MSDVVLKSLGDLLLAVERGEPLEVVAKKSDTVTTRKAAWVESINEMDLDKIAEVEEVMSRYPTRLATSVTQAKSGEVGLLTDEAKVALMEEYLDYKQASEFLEARRSMIRSQIFETINVELAEEGNEDPENMNGVITVPSLKKKFCREGAGYKEPTLDKTKLKTLLTEDEVNQVFRKEKVTKVVETFSEEGLVQLAATNPEILEKLRDCLVPGKPKSPTFRVRDMK